MRTIRLALTMVWFLIVAALQIGIAAQPPIVHFIGIADTEARGIGPHVEAALSNATTAMLERVPKARQREHTALVGVDCEIERIMSTFRNFEVAADDTVVVYYAGHGAFDQQNGTLFLPQRNPGKGLRMRSLVTELQRKQPRLVVMLVDCCQTPLHGTPYSAPMTIGRSIWTEVPPLEQSLYFDSAPGTLILFATERNQPVPCGIPINGSISSGTLFSEALLHSMTNAQLGAVGWSEFGLRVKARVNETFARHQRDANGRLILSPGNQRVDIPHQRVWAQMIDPNGQLTTIINPQ
jgi:Caspase domain